ncbi:diphthine--ammonia ligase [Flavobacterium columnare]|uniref:Diphthine--ammonia ligase n=1 Tax=Flavobacterium columnare TaxID=996 RepID=A0A437UEH0_9FLAO|nr:diphthine--ammonia ligase [Flavobacterium columnare]RVU91959.1 diphthine--ammonia ligase [Flavobacterium columnare]
MKSILSWSGGKDSCLATIKALELGYKPIVLLNMMNENGKVSRSHGLTQNILKQHANALKIPLVGIPTTWADYEKKYIETLCQLKKDYGVESVVFGDIDLEPHREWEQKVCQQAKLEAILPLWQKDRLELVKEIIEENIVCMIVSCNTTMGVEFLGKILTKETVQQLIDLNIDPCGENGEFHTVVINCTLFDTPIILPKYKKEIYQNYCFLVWEE